MHKGLVRDLKTEKSMISMILTSFDKEFNTQHEIREKIVVCGAGGGGNQKHEIRGKREREAVEIKKHEIRGKREREAVEIKKHEIRCRWLF